MFLLPDDYQDIADPRTLRNPTKNQAAVPFVLRLKDVGDDNWALFHTFSSEVSEKPGFRNNKFFFQIRSSTTVVQL
jgi:hypothetical protein